MNRVFVLSMVICLCGTIMAAIGTGMPYWIKRVDGDVGLWQTCRKVLTTYKCSVTVNHDWLTSVKALNITGTLSLALSMLFIGLFWTKDAVAYLVRGAIYTSAFGGLALIAAVVVYGVEQKDFKADFHASFYLTLISGADGLLASILMLILIRVRGEYISYNTF